MKSLGYVAWLCVLAAACGGPDETDAGADATTDASRDAEAADTGRPVDGGPSCDDGRANGDESDVDCGGECAPCRAGAACASAADCIGALCVANVCVDPACDDGAQNGDESDVDCGGDCAPCSAGAACETGRDCVSRFCGATGLCLPPACDDGVRNGDESGVDCGGACGPCAECDGCSTDLDCARGRCAMGRCALAEELYVDWRAHCSVDGSRQVTADLPAGRYRVTAVPSGGTVWSSAAPPTRGWYYRIECVDFAVPSVATPSGVYYANASTAFAALMSTTEDADFAGGTLACSKRDSTCTDNGGGVRFRVERLCL